MGAVAAECRAAGAVDAAKTGRHRSADGAPAGHGASKEMEKTMEQAEIRTRIAEAMSHAARLYLDLSKLRNDIACEEHGIPLLSPEEMGDVEVSLGSTEAGEPVVGVRVMEVPQLARPHEIFVPEDARGMRRTYLPYWGKARDRWWSVLLTAVENARLDGLIPKERPFAESGVVFIRVCYPDRRLRDVDNIAVKAIVDALRHLGLLADDARLYMAYALSAVPESEAPMGSTEVIVVPARDPWRPETWPRWSLSERRRVRLRSPAEVAERIRMEDGLVSRSERTGAALPAGGGTPTPSPY